MATEGRRHGKRMRQLVDQAVVDGVEGKLQAVGNAELIEDVVQVILDGLLADEELFADFLVAVALRDQLDDLLFAVAEQRLIAARAPSEDFENAFMTSAVMWLSSQISPRKPGECS